MVIYTYGMLFYNVNNRTAIHNFSKAYNKVRLTYKRIVDSEIEVAKISPSKLKDLLMGNLIQVLRRTADRE